MYIRARIRKYVIGGADLPPPPSIGLTHCSHGLFSCVELHFGLLSAVEKLMYLQDCGFGEMFVTISSMSAIVRPLSSVSFHVHLQVVSTSDHVDLQTLLT